MLCCCFLLGIFAILKSNEVQQAKMRRGANTLDVFSFTAQDYNAASYASQSVRKLNKIGFAIGICSWISAIIIVIIYIVIIVCVSV